MLNSNDRLVLNIKIVEIFNSWLKKFQVSAFDEETNKGTIKFLVVRVLNEKALITVVVNDKKIKNVQELSSMLQDQEIDFGLNLNINQTDEMGGVGYRD